MKPFHPASCSCTGCVYRSRSKEPNVQQLIQGGSEIDKLFYGKFLPLRERKLLEKLIRTRDVYDEVRSQLLCPCTSSERSRGHRKKRRNDYITDSSRSVLEMVDRGRGYSSGLNSCCSCCSCETLRKIRKRMQKEKPKDPCVYRPIVTCEDLAKFCAEAAERGRKRRRKLSTRISAKIGSASMKIKKHLSEPCACGTLSVSSASTHASKAFRYKLRSKKKARETDLSRGLTIDHESEISKVSRLKIEQKPEIPKVSRLTIDQKTEMSKVSRKSRKKEKNIQISATKDSGTELRSPIKSPIAFKIKKDSLILFKEKLLKKRTYDENEDVECKPGTCDVSECMAEECFKHVKAKDGKVKSKRKPHSRYSDTRRDRSYVSESSRTKKVKLKETRVQHEPACPCPYGPCLCESKRKSLYSMNKILKRKLKQSVSKLDIKGKKPQPQQFEKATKHEKSAILAKSSASMTSIPKSKTKAQSATKEEKTASKSKPKAKWQLVAKDKEFEEKEKFLAQVSPKSSASMMSHEPDCPCPYGPCLCESKRKYFYSKSTLFKRKLKQSISKLDIKGKKSKLRPQFEKATKQEKSAILAKSSASMTSIPKSKTKAQSATKEEKTASKSKPKAKRQLVAKDKELEEKEKFLAQVSPKSSASMMSHEPECPCPYGPCLCESKRKSFYSMSTILKRKLKKSISKLDIKGKKPKLRPQFEKATKQEKSSILTKSSASMSFIPKSKTKAQSVTKEEKIASISKPTAKLQLEAKDKELEEKEKFLVQVSPKSDLGNEFCECRSSTNSTPSITPSPKQKVSKSGTTPAALREMSRHRSKRESHQNLDEGDAKVAPSPKEKISKSGPKPTALREMSHHKSKRESHQNLDEADVQALKGNVKPKRETRMKPIHGRIKQHKKHHHKTQSEASQESYLRESASQATEFYRGKVLTPPGDCEPSICIPYGCDPEKCAEILLRSKSRGKSAKVSTDRLRRKSVGSTAFSQRTSSRSRSKSKHNVSKSADSFKKKTKYVSKEPPPQIVERNTGAESYQPDRQAVKISSSFSFNIEFYKDTFPGDEGPGNHIECVCENVDKKKSPILDHQNTIKQKKHRRKYKNHGTGYSSSKDRGTGDSSSRYNISSQSSSSQSSKNIQVGHKLKRCFCTLKMLQKKKQKVTHTVSKKTMAAIQNKETEIRPTKKRTQTKQSGIAYVVPPTTSRGSSLLPYECEPGFCTPGECNPYECAERIKQRHRRAGKQVSRETNTAVSPKVSTFTSQSVSKSSRKIQSAENKKIKQKERHSQSPIQPAENKNIKQKERYSHSRNIEPKVSSDKSERQAVRIGSKLSLNIEFSKTNINDDTTENFISDMPRKKERKHLHQTHQKGIKVKPRVRHDSSETTNNDVKTKQTYTEPFLQRCLCTLKLLKKNKKKGEPLSPWRNKNEYVMHMQNESVTTRAKISYNHEQTNIFPDEYGSGLCPYPYNYEKFIQSRQMRLKHKYSNHRVELGSQPTCSKAITSSKTRNPCLIEQSQQKVKKRNRDYYETHLLSKHRLVRVGSNMSNNLINKHTHNQKLNRPLDRESIDTDADSKGKNSSVVSTIKRYFSNLKFQNKTNKLRQDNKTKEINEYIKTSYPVPNLRKCDYQSPRRRLSKNNYDLNRNDCAPKSCKPAICDQNECYEDNKWRTSEGLHRHYVSTNKRERITTLNITRSDFIGSTNAKSTHSRLLKHTTTKEQNLRDNQKYMKAAVSFSPQAARKVSDLSFNKEFTKNRFVSFDRNNENRESSRRLKNKAEKYNILREISVVNTTNKSTENKHVASEDYITQADKFRKQAKTSNVGFLLKKCLCTLGLQKKGLPNSQFQWQQPITTQFVQVEHNKNRLNMHNGSKSGPNTLDNTMNRRQPFKSTLPEGGYVFREDFIGNQSGIKIPHQYGPQNLPKCYSYSRQVHVRSSLDLSFDKMKCLLNPFYKSFYALNVKISNLIPKGRNTGDCKPKDCDPDDCSTRMKRLRRLKKLATKDDSAPKTDCYEKCKEEFQNKDKKKPKGKDKPLIIGSDLKFRAGVYRDKNPYKNKRHQAIRVGSDVSVNFDFFKEPHNRTMFKTGALPPKQPSRRAARPPRRREEIDSQGSAVPPAVPHMLRKCFCSAKMKKAYGTKSDEINQYRDVAKPIKPYRYPRRKSMTRILRREKCPLQSKSVQYEDYKQKHHQPRRYYRKKDRNNVTFCTNVNCLEYNAGDRQIIGRGAGDAEKHHGPVLGKIKPFDKCSAVERARRRKVPRKKKRTKRKKKKRKLRRFMDKCYCHFKRKGKKLGKRPSMERIGPNRKICKELARAEREMETIMPYSKRKFKNIDSRPELAVRKKVCPKCRTASIVGVTTGTESGDSDTTCLCRNADGTIAVDADAFSCECKLAEKCPVCKAKETGTYSRKKFMKKPCTCMDEPKKEEPKKDMSKCPMCKQNYKKGVSTCPCCKKPFAAGVSGPDRSQEAAVKKKLLDLNKPLFQMTVNKTNMRIVNKDEVIKKMGSSAKAMQRAQKALESTKYHSSKCKCCICVAKRKAEQHGGPTFTMDARKLKPCICGSVVCKKDWEKIKQEQRSRAAVKIKKCVCGSNICGEESQKMPEMLLEAAKQAEHDREMARRAQRKEKLYQQARKKRLKERGRSLRKAVKARKRVDKYELKSIKKNLNAGSIALFAESLIDLGTFGSKAFCDVAKYVYKGVVHPRDAISDLKDAISDPGQAMKTIAKGAEGMGFQATIQRIKERFKKMPLADSAVSIMESNATTNYLLHMADRDPKKRMKEFKKKRYREPMDFQCSLYMATMRRRPCLRVYYMCPWFYPHCMSLLNLWKQFMDIFLFVFAVLVWSPCILCMEICRGCVCCIMCQA